MVSDVYSAELNSLGVDIFTHQAGHPTTVPYKENHTIIAHAQPALSVGQTPDKVHRSHGHQTCAYKKVITYKGITRCGDSPHSSQLPTLEPRMMLD